MALASESLETLRDLYQHLPCGIHSLDPDGLLVSLNDTELEWLGYTREELVGKVHFIELLTKRSRRLFAENFPRFKALGVIRDLELEVVRKDGTTFPVLISATAIRDSAGHFLMSRSIVYDITVHKQAEETQLRLAAIIDFSEDAILWTDLDFIIQSWNTGAHAIFGYTAAEAIGQPISMVVPKERQHEFAEIGSRIRRGDHIRQYETERLRKNGRRIHVSLTISPVKDAAGHLLGFSTIARDITAQRRERLRREELISRLQNALARVKLLSGLLPICASCKRIRDPDGQWRDVESYIHDHSEASFTHGICPDCQRMLYPDIPVRVVS